MKHRVALSLIVGDGQKPEDWDALLRSVIDVADHIYVSYNGKQKDFPYRLQDNMTVAHHPWEDNFSKARNNALSMFSMEDYDWWMWLDTDDTLVGDANKFHKMLDRADREGMHQIFLPYIYASDEKDGTPRVTQWRERVLSTKVPWRWYYRIHEICHTRPGSNVVNYDDVLVLHHRDVDPFTHRATRERNRRILAAAIAADPDEPRYHYYHANETFAEAYYLWEQGDSDCVTFFREAIKMYGAFGRLNPTSDDAYIANHRIGDAYRMLGEYPKALDVAMQGIKIRPRWPESWALATHSMLGMREFEACDEFASISIEICQEPKTNQISEPLTLHYTPYALRALARTELGNYVGAQLDYDKALAYWDNPKLRERMAEMHERRDRVNSKTADADRKKLKHKRPQRSIAFMSRPLFEPWNAKTLAEGSGGTEWCIHEIARRFKADGYRTAIFGTPGDERGVDDEGIEWWDSSDWDPNEEFGIVTSVRAPEVFDTPIKARTATVLWLHDINMGGPEIAMSPWGNRFDKPDHVICLTDFHSVHEQRIYGVKPEKITVIGNGINLADYPEWGERQKGKFIYASSPDRGIDTLLSMWETIKNEIPEAELHVYYGWNALDRIVALSGGQHPLAHMKAGIVEQYEAVKHLGVEWHNRVARPELQKVETTCDAWLYPTNFLETFCITALEMQMNGVIPVVNPVGALPEVVFNLKGSPRQMGHPSGQRAYIDRLKLATENYDPTLRERGREFASQFTWDHRYDQWRDMLGLTRTSNKPVKERV